MQETAHREQPPGEALETLVAQIIEQAEPARALDPAFITLLARASQSEQEQVIMKLLTSLKKKGLTRASLVKCITSEQRKKKSRPAAREPESLPSVAVNVQYREMLDESLTALGQANSRALTAGGKDALYVQSNRLVCIDNRKDGTPALIAVTQARLRTRLSLAANFVVTRTVQGETIETPALPPVEVLQGIIDMNPALWPFPEIKGITDLPIPRADGSILVKPGYDPITKVCYIPGRVVIPAIPQNPTAKDIEAALKTLYYPFVNFPCEDEASRTSLLAMELAVALRPVIDGVFPFLLINAKAPGTGKTLLSSLFCLLAAGHSIPPNFSADSEDEWRKKAVSALLAGDPVVFIDNIDNTIEFGPLSSVLTAPVVRDRVLGSNDRYIDAENRALWILNGNHLQVGNDMQRRAVVCNLNANMEDPETRSPDSFQEKDLPGWILAHRGEVIGAALTLYRAWHIAGRPLDKAAIMGSFQPWADVIGGILKMIGVSGFLGNRGSSQQNQLKSDWRAFVSAMSLTFGEEPFTSAMLAEKILSDNELRELVPAQFAESLDQYCRADGKTVKFPTHLGQAFAKRDGNWFADFCLKRAEAPGRANKKLWTVEVKDTPDARERRAAELVKVIEAYEGQISQDGRSHQLEMRMPATFNTDKYRALKKALDTLIEHVCQLKGWPAPEPEIVTIEI